MPLNDYNQLAEKYRESDTKPDKRFSILPTVLKAIGSLRGKTVLDLGCGSGFFSRAFIEQGAKFVTGIDNSEVQIEEARKFVGAHEEYRLADAFTDSLPNADVIHAPFLINYLARKEEIVNFLKNIRGSLNESGVAVFVIDLPTALDLKKYGATKRVDGNMKDGAPMTITLYNGNGAVICDLHAFYISSETFESCLREAGFSSVSIIEPVVSEKGEHLFGKDYWNEYLKETQLGYYLCS